MSDGEGGTCGGCALTGAMQRRDFVREAALAALAAIGGLAVTPDVAEAVHVSFVRGTGGRSAKSYPLPQTDGVSIDREESVIIARAAGRAFAFSLACPHQNTALRWDGKNRRFQCPKHKSRYQPDGVFIEGRATRGLDRFAVRRDGAQIVVDLDTLYREDRHPAQWAAAFVDTSEK